MYSPTSTSTCALEDDLPLGMDSAQVGILEKTNQVGLGSLLQSQHSVGLEAQIGL